MWLDDETLSISYERDNLIPKRFDMQILDIIGFETISELMEYLSQNSISEEDIFVIDIMLIFEEQILLPDNTSITIPDELMAGAILYSEYLKDKFPNNPIILYTSREHEGEVFKNIINDPRFEKSLFLVDKWQKDTKFIEVLEKFIGEKDE